MIGIGTLCNTAAVIVGGCIGMMLKNGLNKKTQTSLMNACGVASMFIGAAGVMSKMLVISDDVIETQGTMMLIISLVVGTVIGELIKIEDGMEVLGENIKRAIKRENDSLFVDGFVNVSLIICVGAMAIVGSIQDGVSGDYSMLAAKAVLDGIIVIVFASSYGVGAVFSAVPIFVYQGLITLIAAFGGEFVGSQIIDSLTFIGSSLIFCVGINICFGKKFRVGNMLPSLVVAVIMEWLI